MEFALSTCRTQNFITFWLDTSVDIALTGQLYDKLIQLVYI
jgi:hypothetical protein